jgi:hypothetical protein
MSNKDKINGTEMIFMIHLLNNKQTARLNHPTPAATWHPAIAIRLNSRGIEIYFIMTLTSSIFGPFVGPPGLLSPTSRQAQDREIPEACKRRLTDAHAEPRAAAQRNEAQQQRNRDEFHHGASTSSGVLLPI